MSDQVTKQIELEIAHILFIDAVGYSKLSINEQRAVVDEMAEVVRSSDQYQKAEAAGRFIKIPTGDGMAMVFYTSPEAPAQCAVEISRLLKKPLCRSSGQSATAKKVPGPEEAQRATPLGSNDGCIARARGNRRWHRNVFSFSRAIAVGRDGQKHRGASL